MRHSPNKSSRRSVSLLHAALGSAPARSARLPALQMRRTATLSWFWARGCLRVAAAWLLALPSTQPPASRGTRLPALPGAVRDRCLPALSRSHRRAVASGELHMPTSLDSPSYKEIFALKLHIASIFFRVFQMFQTYVVSVSYGCCKSRSGCCICCNGCTRMLQAPILNVSSVFFPTYVASVFIWMLHMFSHIRCKCFIWMLHMFTMTSSVFRCFCKYFRHIFQMFHLFSDVCCNCCI
jgi:hypothetical protein